MQDIKIDKKEDSTVEITGSISFDVWGKHKEKALKDLSKNIKIDGFRPGSKIPENVLVDKVGEMAILNEMAQYALNDAYPIIVMENKIDVIGSPQIAITKIAKDNPLEFKITTAVMPEIKLPDYKKLAKKEMDKKEESLEVTEEELSKTIEQIQKAQQHTKKEGEEITEKDLEKKSDKLPELTDEFVKTVGDFKNVDDFKSKLKENIRHEKEHRLKEKKRLEILDAIIKDTKMNLPEVLVEAESQKMLAEMRNNISRMGLQFEKYLEQIKKTEEDLKKEWRTDAEKRVKSQLVLNQISLDEKITPPEDEVKKNVDAILGQHKDARRENVEVYVKMMVSNEEVFKLLEK